MKSMSALLNDLTVVLDSITDDFVSINRRYVISMFNLGINEEGVDQIKTCLQSKYKLILKDLYTYCDEWEKANE